MVKWVTMLYHLAYKNTASVFLKWLTLAQIIIWFMGIWVPVIQMWDYFISAIIS